MQLEVPNQPVASRPPVRRWLAWAVLVLIGATIIVGELAAIDTAQVEGSDKNWFPLLLVVVLYIAIFFGLKATFHPIRGRGDERPSWKQRFPTHTDEEIQRFIRVVGESFGFRARNWSKLRPDDGLTAISQQWFCGDGMELVELVMLLEHEYSVELPEEFLTTEKTLGELFDYVSQRRAGHPPTPDSARTDQAMTG